jgi:hypothetical protein
MTVAVEVLCEALMKSKPGGMCRFPLTCGRAKPTTEMRSGSLHLPPKTSPHEHRSENESAVGSITCQAQARVANLRSPTSLDSRRQVPCHRSTKASNTAREFLGLQGGPRWTKCFRSLHPCCKCFVHNFRLLRCCFDSNSFEYSAEIESPGSGNAVSTSTCASHVTHAT